MKKAIVTKSFYGVEDGQVYPRHFAVDEIIYGELAESEIEAGRAKPEGEDSKKPPARKALDGPTRNKQFSSSQPAQASTRKTLKLSKAKRKS